MASQDSALAAIFIIILIASLVLNILFIVIVCLRRRLHNGHYLLFTSQALVDIIIAGTWTCLTAVTLAMGWDMEGGVCRFQSYMHTLAQSWTAFTLAVIGIERLTRMMKPSRHALIFIPKITLFLVLALMVFCGVIASIHLYGSLPVSWLSKQRQCGAHFTESIRILDFTFCFDHAIPYWVFALPSFLAAYVKILVSKQKSPPSGEIILEKNVYAPGDSYSGRLKTVQKKFCPKTNSYKKATLGKRVYTSKGYIEPEHWDSEIEDGIDNTSSDTRQKWHLLPRPEFTMLVTSSLTALVTALMWFPWVVVRFVWNYTPYQSVPDWVGVIAVLLMHMSTAVKPIILYATNPYFRSAASKTFACRKK